MKYLGNLRLTHRARGKRDENSEGKKRDEKKSEKEGNDIEENIPCGDAVKSEGSSYSHGDVTLCCGLRQSRISKMLSNNSLNRKLQLSVGSFESLRRMFE